jgi:hypothetical protein
MVNTSNTGGSSASSSSSTGGAAATGGSAPTGGTSAVIQSTTGGLAPTGGTSAVSQSTITGGVAATGGTSSSGGSLSTGGTSGGDTSVGGVSGTGGTSATGTTSLQACTTTSNALLTCLPPAAFYYDNSSSSPDRDPMNDPYIGNYQYHVYQDTIQLYGTIAAPGRFWQGSPYTDADCVGRGVDATGRSGLRVTTTNNATTPVTLVLHVSDLGGTTAPYPVIKLQATVEVPPGGPAAYDVPFTEFVATCSTTAAFNPALIAQVGLGFASTGTLDLTISSLSFY